MNDVRQFGAVGDGVTLDTAAIQRAIDAGGMVNFPPGTYRCGTLYLKSYGGLHLETGATILASDRTEDYNADDFCVQNRPRYKEEASGAHLIVGVEVTHVTISGEGAIDGCRKAFEHTPCEEWGGKYAVDRWRPSQMIYLVESDHIVLRDVELVNAPYWSCFLHGCDDVSISGLRIFTEWRTRNGDGIDIDCCRRVTVSDCLIDTGDDCLTLRADRQGLKDQSRVCEDVTISNCVLKTCCNAIRVGVGSGIIRRAVFGNITIHDTRTAICVVSKYGAYHGVTISDIRFHDFMLECKRPFLVQSDVRGPVESQEQQLSDIEFTNIRGYASRSSLIQGNPGYPLRRVFFRNIDLVYSGGEDIEEQPVYAENRRRGSAPEAFHIEYADEVLLERVRLDWSRADGKFKRSCLALNSTKVELRHIHSTLPGEIR